MKKFAALTLLCALAFCGAPVLAEAPLVSTQHWKIVITVTSKEGDEIKLIYGAPSTGPIYFASEVECTAAIKSDVGFLHSLALVALVVQKREDKMDNPACVLDVKDGVI